MQNRSMVLDVDGTTHVLNRYFVQVGLPRYVSGEGDTFLSSFPHFYGHLPVLSAFLLITTLLLRPESYTDDLELAEGLSDGE